MADVDWNRWLPPHPLPSVPYEFKTGQVWAWSSPGDAVVFGVLGWTWDDGAAAAKGLARKAYSPGSLSGMGKMAGEGEYILVQDVGQPDPTPPEVLYGPQPGQWWATKDGG